MYIFLNLGYDTGKIKEKEVLLNVDALNIGTCLEEDTWMRCSGGCNSHEIGGICQGKSCKSGEKAGVEIKCENCKLIFFCIINDVIIGNLDLQFIIFLPRLLLQSSWLQTILL